MLTLCQLNNPLKLFILQIKKTFCNKAISELEMENKFCHILEKYIIYTVKSRSYPAVSLCSRFVQ